MANDNERLLALAEKLLEVHDLLPPLPSVEELSKSEYHPALSLREQLAGMQMQVLTLLERVDRRA